MSDIRPDGAGIQLVGGETVELSWQERSLCAQTDPEAFFPEKGGSTREAKRVCMSCDVRSECLEY
ncbi:MAG: WhiB family transcriptional regulator, partial [Actinobacteria bacterium]|nr:WhiB family transcriptional regulator [Actinomycetota bacterium]MSY55385.1 WhiB family transcriptional regulator [Actinomycetota bacterium]